MQQRLNFHRPLDVLREVLVHNRSERRLVPLQVVRLRLAGVFFKKENTRLQLTCMLQGDMQCYAWLGGPTAERFSKELETAPDHIFLIDTSKEVGECIVGIQIGDNEFEPVFAHESGLRAQR